MTATAQQRRIIKAYADNRGMRYRITKAGDVHLYGKMPNSNKIAWFLFACSADDAVRKIQPKF